VICYRTGEPVNNGDIVHALGFDPAEFTFEVCGYRHEGVAVIKNLADGFDSTSTVPVDQLTLVRRGDPTNSVELATRLVRDPDFRRRAMEAGYVEGEMCDVHELVARMRELAR
jgi:hypothetical protein